MQLFAEPQKDVHIEPRELRFTDGGGFNHVCLRNPTSERFAVKTKTSDNCM
jgi:hypothetical protein